ncbi:MAG TPA: SLC13 family permease, partial [Blastocatellia bacterium]
REKYGMNVLAIWRAGEQIYEGLADLPLQFGDAMLLQGQRERVEVLRDEPDIIVLAYEEEQSRPVPGKGHLAMAIMCLTLIIAAIKPQIVSEIMLGGALAMMVAGMLTMDEAYQAIDWKSVFIVACMLPMGLAMTKTGASALLANGMISMLGPTGPLVLLAGLFILTVLMTQAINGAAVAAVVAPVAIRAAQQIGANPRAFAMGVALATSMAFLTPLGHPVSVLVMGPAGYSFRDYFKAGFPLTLIILVVVMTLLPLFWPL